MFSQQTKPACKVNNSCTQWQIDSYIDDVEDYYAEVERYNEEVRRYNECIRQHADS